MNKQELINRLLYYKERVQNPIVDISEIIRDAVSDVCDYDRYNDYELDSYTYTFETYDWLREFLDYTMKEFWPMVLKNRLSELERDEDYYIIDDVDWTVYNVYASDVVDWCDDVLYELWYEEDESTN